MTDDEAAELAARIEQDLLAEPGVLTVYPTSGAGLLREAAARLRGADDGASRVVVRPGEVTQVEVSLGVDDERPARETARAAQRIIRGAAQGPVQIRLTVAHLDAAPPDVATTTP